MALKASNINVGLRVEPEKVPPKQESIGALKATNITILKKDEPTFVAPEPEPVKPEKYIIKQDGELIVNLNTKSDYLRDVLDLD
jgi:hypothetical protein